MLQNANVVHIKPRYGIIVHNPSNPEQAFKYFGFFRYEHVKDQTNKVYQYFNKEIDELFANDVRVNIIGDTSMFSPKVKQAIENAHEKTKACKKLVFSIALGYGARAEIAQAINKMLAEGKKDVTEEDISKYLYTFDMPDPDLIIRTSGEQRLSNFLLYQAAYSEFYFTDTLWPDFDENEFDKAIEEYQRRDRRFGGVK